VIFSIGMTVGWNKLGAVPAIRTRFDSQLPELPELRGACSSLQKNSLPRCVSFDVECFGCDDC
jgi:hypothetical protein